MESEGWMKGGKETNIIIIETFVMIRLLEDFLLSLTAPRVSSLNCFVTLSAIAFILQLHSCAPPRRRRFRILA